MLGIYGLRRRKFWQSECCDHSFELCILTEVAKVSWPFAFRQVIPHSLGGVFSSFQLLLERAKHWVGLTKLQICFVFSKMEIKPEYTPDGSSLVLVHLVLGIHPQKDVNVTGVHSRNNKMLRSCKA